MVVLNIHMALADRGIVEAVESGELNISRDEEQFLHHQSDGFFADGLVVCITKKADYAVLRYAAGKGIGIKLTADVKQKLIDKGYVEQRTKGDISFKYTRQREIYPLRPRIYKIKLAERLNDDGN